MIAMQALAQGMTATAPNSRFIERQAADKLLHAEYSESNLISASRIYGMCDLERMNHRYSLPSEGLFR